MIRFRLKELMAEKSFKEGKPTSLVEVATQTGIARSTLNRAVSKQNYTLVKIQIRRRSSSDSLPIGHGFASHQAVVFS